METAGPFSWNAGPFPSGASPGRPSRHLLHFQNPAKTKSTPTRKYFYACAKADTIQGFCKNLELKTRDWPFLNLHPPQWAGPPGLLQLQHLHSSLSYASCASCVSYLFYASFPSSFSSSFHCHQHLRSEMTNLLLGESQPKGFNRSSTCPPSSNLAWGSTPWSAVGLFGWWWRSTGWARRWQGSGCSSWMFVSCRWRRNRSRGSSPQGLRTWTWPVKGQTWNSWAIQLQPKKYWYWTRGHGIYLGLLRGSGVRDTLRMGLPLCGGDFLLWLKGEVPEASKRPWGLVERLRAWLRVAGEGERRLAAAAGDRVSRLLLAATGLLLCLSGDWEDGGVRLLCGGEALRLGDLEGRRLAMGGERLTGETENLLFCGGKGEGL